MAHLLKFAGVLAVMWLAETYVPHGGAIAAFIVFAGLWSLTK